ncbi:MAG: HAD-IIA family hydrolase [Spirochaetales bacterium]|nr:HAD-IIA family hydrolase [Leptospiraceae bacterium]MCP5480389.1 HAD-IIA family hydrolase [Spirochaetales bacterium]
MSLLIEPSFWEIAKNYRVIMFDAFGVLKNSHGIIEGVPDTVARFREAGIASYVLTNDASRSPQEMEKTYTHARHGALIPATHIVSSGMLASEFLALKVRSGPVGYIGKEASAHYVRVAGLEPIPVDRVTDPDSLRAFCLLDDEGFDWFLDINRAVNLLRRVNIPIVVANTDIAYPIDADDVAVAVGSLANMMEGIVRKTFIRFGKPDTQIFSFAYARVREAIPDIKKNEVLMVGDTLTTDIIGANKFGIDSALVLSGNTQRSRADVMIQASGIIPTFVFDSVRT